MKVCKHTTDLEDIILWPDGSYCYRYELHEFRYKSDESRNQKDSASFDYVVYNFGTKEYTDFFASKLT